MSTVFLNESQLKDLLKAAIIEVLEERRDLVRDAIEEALEDVALARAIAEGEETDPVDRATVFAILNANA